MTWNVLTLSFRLTRLAQVKHHERLRKDLQECMDGICEKHGIDATDAGDPESFENAMENVFDKAKEVRSCHARHVWLALHVRLTSFTHFFRLRC